ncbi:glutathione S-transferase family protein [Alcanivorax sp. S6407]|uniref:glutathione S-transferase family protein n=1 Tax=Alcanivorax sp. S6407 TaxID=2926424 RepID=UPI001FF28B27|nr:glutathione S-transferase family protein [Alcanivorax sp. S6407]MCK0154952.1 glutathione S-transferase family protein [Alcanivorax sp. S6407]
MTDRILYQFPISHYCEKTRWQLDHKGLDYQIRNLLPGPHRLRTRLMARIDTLPILRDDRRTVGDSTKIAYYLEKYYPQRSLLPAAPDQRARVIELEQQFDRLGVDVRRWLYGQIIDRPEVMQAMLNPYGLPGVVQSVLTPLTREGVRRLYRIEPKAVMRSEQRLEEGLQLLEQILAKGKGDYLVGDQLTLADVAAASLLAPLLSPAGTPWDIIDENSHPPALQVQLQKLRERPAGQWVMARYAGDR